MYSMLLPLEANAQRQRETIHCPQRQLEQPVPRRLEHGAEPSGVKASAEPADRISGRVRPSALERKPSTRIASSANALPEA